MTSGLSKFIPDKVDEGKHAGVPYYQDTMCKPSSRTNATLLSASPCIHRFGPLILVIQNLETFPNWPMYSHIVVPAWQVIWIDTIRPFPSL